MGDGLKLPKDKRHRSSSSLAGVVLEGTRSERKLDVNAAIPEMDDQFATAESRCEDLQEKIDLIKSLKRKRKLKKRSMTRVTDPPMTPENVPFITVRTQPKKKVSQQAARLRRLEVPPNPTRGYLDPATVEQHRMIGQVRGYNQAFKHPHQEHTGLHTSADQRTRHLRSHAEGDTFIPVVSSKKNMCGQRVQIPSEPPTAGCGQDDTGTDYSNYDVYDGATDYSVINVKKPTEIHQVKQQPSRRRHVPKDTLPKEVDEITEQLRSSVKGESAIPRSRQPANRNHLSSASRTHNTDDRPVVELFSKSRTSSTDVRKQAQDKKTKKNIGLHSYDTGTNFVPNTHNYEDQTGNPLEPDITIEPKKEPVHHPRRVKYRSRRYELPTVASQMKQAGVRYYYGTANHTNIPFVVSKSTAPSHNIGVNIQQVLNGLKIQQPLSGIPLTIAHHMGLGHVPTYGTKSATVPSLDQNEINVIRVGRKMLRLPSYKYMSYNRLLNLYREGDGMVPRFLRAISRPHYFYTSMYNLATNREDFDGATSKGRGGSQEAKQSLAEYASLYREYEHIDKCIKEGNYEPELERRREELTRELAAREEHIRRVVQEYRPGETEKTLRASASIAEESYRHPSFKMGDPQQ